VDNETWWAHHLHTNDINDNITFQSMGGKHAEVNKNDGKDPSHHAGRQLV
jgi:hypothetical protein